MTLTPVLDPQPGVGETPRNCTGSHRSDTYDGTRVTTLQELDRALTSFPVTLERAALRRFRAELRTLVELGPIAGLVPTVGGGIDAGGHPYVEHVPDPGLHGADARAVAPGTLDLDEAVRVAARLLAALAGLHAAGLVHGAVRPEVVVRTADGPALTDPVPFAVAERLGGALGPAFAAPEVLRGELPTAAADVFAAATTLVALATGRPPWSEVDTDADTVLLQITAGAPPDLGAVDARPALADALLRALALDPAQRPSAGELRTALAGGGRDLDELDTLPPPTPTSPALRMLGPAAVPGPGTRVGSSCVLGEPLGRGATGTVFRATHAAAGEVAVKVLRTDLTDDPAIVDRFVGERSTLKRIDHPNVVRVLDLVAEAATVAIVMELVDGPDLRRWLRAAPPLAPAAACALLAQLAGALDAVHRAGVVHRDLKPENVLLERIEQGERVEPVEPGGLRVRLTDFGIAYSARDDRRRTGHGQVVGTPDYLAPEVATGATAGPPADIYALGIVAYELVAGCRPFTTADATARLLQPPAGRAPVPRPSHVDDALWSVVASCLADDPLARPSAVAVAEALAGRGQGQGQSQNQGQGRLPSTGRHDTGAHPTEPGVVLPTRPPDAGPDDARRRRALRWGAAVAVVVALLAGTAVGALTGGHDDREPPATTPVLPEVVQQVYVSAEVERIDADEIRLTFDPVEGATEYHPVRDPRGESFVMPIQAPEGGSILVVPDGQNDQDHCYVVQATLVVAAGSAPTTAPSPFDLMPACTRDRQP
jgi:serine/threonine protein kinase